MAIVYLNLPHLPDDLSEKLIKFAAQVPPDESGRQWLEDFHQHRVQVISQVYGRPNTFVPEDILKEIEDIYAPYFKEKIYLIIGNLSNTAHSSSTADSPPHCDRYRKTAINYILDTGGENVITSFYKEKRPYDDLTLSENRREEDLTLDFSLCLSKHSWHAYNVQAFHGVKGIKNTRILFSIFLESNPDIDSFIAQYPNLIKMAN